MIIFASSSCAFSGIDTNDIESTLNQLTYWGRDKWPPFFTRHFEMHFLNENIWISIKISLTLVPKRPINNALSLVQIMARRRPGQTICLILSYYHHQIGIMNHYPLFRIRSWNSGVRCMSLYILWCHKMSKWYDEPILCYRRVKICNFVRSIQGPSDYSYVYAYVSGQWPISFNSLTVVTQEQITLILQRYAMCLPRGKREIWMGFSL